MSISHSFEKVIAALLSHVVAVEDTWCYRVCGKAEEKIIAAIIAVTIFLF